MRSLVGASLSAVAALSSMVMPLPSQQWHAVLPPPRCNHALAFDLFRNRTVMFGGAAAAPGSHNYFADTWEFDGGSWRQLPVAGPAPRASHALVYDAVRGRTVLFGGQGTVQPLGDTWEYDGTGWTQIPTPVAPSARVGHRMAVDLARATVVLFGGRNAVNMMLADTWEYSGSWHRVAAAHAPAPRAWHGLAHDLGRGRTVLFGGAPADFATIDDTWEYDGVDWVRVTPVASPPGRTACAMTFDAPGARTLLFGGQGSAALDDTWSYDGVTWGQLAAPGPSARSSSAMVHDLVRGRTLLFGGFDGLQIAAGDTWELVGTTWSAVPGTAVPSARESAALVHDLARSRTVLFGGRDNSFRLSAETWELAGATWQRIATVGPGPAGRSEHALAYDAARSRVILFGGQRPGIAGIFNDTWEYAGVNWTLIATATSPRPRTQHALSHDIARGRTVLFGGQNAGAALGDTWEYDGVTWSQRVTTPTPAPRFQHALVYDSARACTVLFGGRGTAWLLLGDTWEYDGASWRAVAPLASPTPRLGHAMVFDPTRARTVLFGGMYSSVTGAVAADVWEYDGSTWNAVAVPAGVPPRQLHVLAYDQGRDRIVLFGGDNGDVLGDTWELDRAAVPTSARHGTGCAGSNGTPSLDAAPGALPALGSTFALQLGSLPNQPRLALVAFGTDLVRWNGGMLPLALDPLGLPGCRLWIGPAPGASLLLAYTGSSAALPVAIPAAPALGGLLVGAQAFVLDPAAPSGLGAVSNGLVLRLY